MHKVSASLAIFLTLALTLSTQFLNPQKSYAAGTNLMPNPSLETVAADGVSPDSWSQGGWGTNTATLSYSTDAHTGSHSVRVDMTSYSSGDAKWYTMSAPVTGGHTYVYSDYYKSNVSTDLLIAIQHSNGSFTYTNDQSLAAASSWTQASGQITLPSDATTVSMFHVIAAVGYLITDDYSFAEYTQVVDNSPIPNPSLEIANGNAPANWSHDSWGTNTPVFTWSTDAHTGSHSVRVDMTSYSSGDAKWYTMSAPVKPGGEYQYADYYKSNVATQLILAIQKTDGSFAYTGYKQLPAASTWTLAKDQAVLPSDAARVAIFHVIAAVGYLITDDYSLAPYVPTPFNRGIVSITMDDGWESQYTNAFPILQKYHATATLYLISSVIDGGDGYLYSNEINQMHTAGFEIGSHTVTHPDLTTLSLTQLNAELKNSKTALGKYGTITDFASPYGAYNDTVISYIKKYYNSHRTVDEGYNTKDNFDQYRLKVQNIDNTTTPAQVQAWAAKAYADKTWLILVYHQVDNSGEQYSTTPASFDAQVSAIRGTGISVQPVRNALTELIPQL